MRQLRRDLRTIVIAMTASALVFSAPALADGVRHALFAHNADKVDNIHAVGAGASATTRANKLVATNRAGRLPNNIIAKAPAAGLADRAKTADSAKSADALVSLNALQGRPCTVAGQAGTTSLKMAVGKKNPSVSVSCEGVVTPDEYEPDSSRETARARGVQLSISNGTISPATDTDWFRYSCSSTAIAGATGVVLTIRGSGAPTAVTTAVFDGFKNDLTAPSVTGQQSWAVGNVAAGESFTVRVHGAQPDEYALDIAYTTAC